MMRQFGLSVLELEGYLIRRSMGGGVIDSQVIVYYESDVDSSRSLRKLPASQTSEGVAGLLLLDCRASAL